MPRCVQLRPTHATAYHPCGTPEPVKRMRIGLLTVAMVLVSASSIADRLTAQVPVVLNGYAGVALPQGDWKDDDGAETGWGYGASLTFRPIPMVGFYGGWDRFRFGIGGDGSTDDVDLTFIDSGLRAGIELNAPLPYVSPFIAGGVFYGETELAVREEDVTSQFRTGSDLGFEASIGVDIDVGPFGIRPRVGYRKRDAEFGSFLGEIGDEPIEVSHINITIGASLVP